MDFCKRISGSRGRGIVHSEHSPATSQNGRASSSWLRFGTLAITAISLTVFHKPKTRSGIIQPHCFPDVSHRFLSKLVRSLTSVRNDVAHQRGVFLVHPCALVHGLLLRQY